MQISSKLIFLCGLLWSFHLTPAASGGSEVDHFSAKKIPIYQKGYNIETYADHATGSELLTYYVRTDHPAAEVLEFYDAYFNGIAWQSSFEICQRHWDPAAGNVTDGEPPSMRLFTAWRAPAADSRVFLWLTNTMDSGQRPSEVFVKFRIQTGMER